MLTDRKAIFGTRVVLVSECHDDVHRPVSCLFGVFNFLGNAREYATGWSVSVFIIQLLFQSKNQRYNCLPLALLNDFCQSYGHKY